MNRRQLLAAAGFSGKRRDGRWQAERERAVLIGGKFDGTELPLNRNRHIYRIPMAVGEDVTFDVYGRVGQSATFVYRGRRHDDRRKLLERYARMFGVELSA